MTRARDLADYISTGVSDTELDVLDGVTAGTVTASKALVVDANKDVASLRNITATGTITGNVTGNVSGSSGSTTGNAATATTAGTVTTAAQTNITSLGTLTTLTVDDITINGSTISDGGDLTISGSDIILDATGGEVRFSDGSQQEFVIDMNDAATKTTLRTLVTDSDLVFEGNDGGASITALTLDMSDAGKATFNNAVLVSGQILAHQTNVGVFEYNSNVTKIHSYGASSGTGQIQLLTGGGGGSTDTLAMTIDNSGNVLVGKTAENTTTVGIQARADGLFAAVKASAESAIFGRNTDDGNIVLFRKDGSTVGSIASVNGNIKVSAYGEEYASLSGTSVTIDCRAGNNFALTTSGNTTFTFSNAPTSGTAFGFTLKLTAGGGHTITYPNTVDFAGGTAPDAPASGETDVLVFITVDGGTNWYGALAIDAAG